MVAAVDAFWDGGFTLCGWPADMPFPRERFSEGRKSYFDEMAQQKACRLAAHFQAGNLFACRRIEIPTSQRALIVTGTGQQVTHFRIIACKNNMPDSNARLCRQFNGAHRAQVDHWGGQPVRATQNICNLGPGTEFMKHLLPSKLPPGVIYLEKTVGDALLEAAEGRDGDDAFEAASFKKQKKSKQHQHQHQQQRQKQKQQPGDGTLSVAS